MRLLALLIALFAAFPAFAGAKLKLVSDRPVVIVVNLVPHPLGENAPVNIEIPSGKEGTQRITVRNLAGQQMYSGTVVVPRDTVVTVAWREKQLEVVDRKMMKTSEAFNRGGRGNRTPAGHKRLDELAATSDHHEGDLLSIAAGATGGAFVPEVIVDDGGTPEEAPGDGAGEPTEAPAASDNGPVQEVAPATRASPTSGKGSSLKVQTSDQSGGAGTTAVVRVVARSESWANVWIGGAKVWEHRGEANAMDVTLPAGTHQVVIRDFRDRDTWGGGTLVVGAGDTVELYFSKTQPIETVGGDWTPSN